MQSRVKQMERRIEREIEEKEGLLEDIECTKDLKLFQLTHYKEILVSYVGQENSGLNGSIPNFCKEYHLDMRLFCAILRQLDFGREQF